MEHCHRPSLESLQSDQALLDNEFKTTGNNLVKLPPSSAMPPSRAQIAVGGMWVNVYGLSELFASGCKEAVVLFFLHGRSVVPFLSIHTARDISLGNTSHAEASLPSSHSFGLLLLLNRFGSAERIEHIVHKTYDDIAKQIKQEQNPSSSQQETYRGIIIVVSELKQCS